jgi:hypothetical protein
VLGSGLNVAKHALRGVAGGHRAIVVPTSNSKTPIAFAPGWKVLDVGSGHAPHPCATVLLERYLDSGHERSGRPAHLPDGSTLVVADAQALPFRLECVRLRDLLARRRARLEPAAPCDEARRVARAGYLESPSPFTETLRHPRNHLWKIRAVPGGLEFRPLGPAHRSGSLATRSTASTSIRDRSSCSRMCPDGVAASAAARSTGC